MSAQATTATAPHLVRPEPAAEPCTIVIFGASGDLTRRMLLPALYNLMVDKALPPQCPIVGYARTE